MNDIRQEWRELRQKNGDFICHLDGEMAKLEKEKKQMFYDPMTGTYYMGALNNALNNNAQYWQEKHAELMLELKDAMAEINNLKHENLKLTEDIKRRKDGDKKMGDAYTKLIEENAELQKKLDSAEKESDDLLAMYDKVQAEAHQANVAKDRMGYSNRCMQSKIAKQSNEIKRLTHENVGLVIDIRRHKDMIEKLKQGHWDEMEQLQNANAKLEYDNFQLKQALGTSAKDAEGNFDRGYHKGMDELWDAIRKAQDECPSVLTDIYGQGCMYDCVSNLSAQDFAKKTIEWEEKQAKDIQIGDEVEIFDKFDPDLDDIGIVIAVKKDNPCFTVIGPNFEGCFNETDIQSGKVKKTGGHYDSIPFAYLT